MPRHVLSPFTLALLVPLTAVVVARQQPQGGTPPPAPPPQNRPVVPPAPPHIPLELFEAPEGLEVTLWAETPMVRNPTNIDIDRDGRIWVAEGVRYRHHHARQPEGDKIVVLEDTDHDGKADKA